MSQIEQEVRKYLSKHPETEKCINLINRRKLAREIIRQGYVGKTKFEALLGVLRRYDFKSFKEDELKLFKKIRIRIKDDVCLLNFEKKAVNAVKKIIEGYDFEGDDTLKIVIGSETTKIFIDKHNLRMFKSLLPKYKITEQHGMSELSILFPKDAKETKGVVSYLTRELYINDITVIEMLTATPELLIYLSDEYSVKAYDVIKRMKE